MEGAVAVADAWVRNGSEPRTIFAVNPEKVIKAQRDGALMAGLRGSGLLIPDGIGVVAAARLLGLCDMQRVPGAELMPALCEHAARRGYRVFLYGASEEVNAKAAAELQRRYSGLQVAGRQHGYVPDSDMPELVQRINACDAQILFVGLGSPHQELWMDRYLSALMPVRVCQGVGGTFDVLAGHVQRAPELFRRIHLEWLYRLLSQPKRLIRQTALPKFAYQAVRAWIDSRRRLPLNR
jgi:N-acetylglucosaminyldiphosphoundecaprenol N-acetyl-beta-D-mannosaminyltransferase